MLRVAINGFGRIGRNILRAIEESSNNNIEVVAVNDLAPLDTNVHLLKYDSNHGRFNADVELTENGFSVNGQVVEVFSQREPNLLPWKDLAIDLVMECTGFFRSKEKASLHLDAGAKKVLVSAPGKGLDATVVYGVNQDILRPEHQLVSNASCTTNCLAQVARALQDSVGIETGMANTIHSYTNTQKLLDAYHKDKRRARAAASSIIPTSTGSAKAIAEVIPELDGRLTAIAVRVPTPNVSLLDFTVTTNRQTDIEELRTIFTKYAETRDGVFSVSDEPLVSIDYNHQPESCIVDLAQSQVNGKMIKIIAWYDNEWAFSNRMIDTALCMA